MQCFVFYPIYGCCEVFSVPLQEPCLIETGANLKEKYWLSRFLASILQRQLVPNKLSVFFLLSLLPLHSIIDSEGIQTTPISNREPLWSLWSLPQSQRHDEESIPRRDLWSNIEYNGPFPNWNRTKCQHAIVPHVEDHQGPNPGIERFLRNLSDSRARQVGIQSSGCQALPGKVSSTQLTPSKLSIQKFHGIAKLDPTHTYTYVYILWVTFSGIHMLGGLEQPLIMISLL